MWVADVVLRRAARLIPLQLSTIALPIDLEAIDVSTARTANLANLDLLESVGRTRDLRGGFWRDLMRACEMLGLDDRMPSLTAEYQRALQRVGASARPSPDPDAMSVASAVCRLPVLFRSTVDRSMVDLLAISGYSPSLTPLIRDVVVAVLRAEPVLVDAWLTHSEDKRTPSGWYFSSEYTSAVVGFHPDGPRFTFADPIEACAEFILREVDGLAESMSRRAGPG